MQFRIGPSYLCSSTLKLLIIFLSMEARLATNSDLNKLDALTDLDWDLAVSQGNGVALISISSEAVYEFIFPMPSLQRNSNRSQPLDVASLGVNTSLISYNELELQWSHFEVRSLTSNYSRNLLYFSNTLKLNEHQVTNLGVFNFTSRETRILLQTISSSIEDLNLFNDDIYFTTPHAIMKIAAGSTFDNHPIVVKQLKSTVTGFTQAIDGALYWSLNDPSFISFQRDGYEKILLSSDLEKAHDLSIFDHNLYFINTPQFGPEKRIERVNLYNPINRETMVDFQRHSHIPGAFTVVCGTLYWTDAMSKALWKTSLPLNSSAAFTNPDFTKVYSILKMNRHFATVLPHAVTSRRNLDAEACQKRFIFTVPSNHIDPATSSQTTVSVPAEIVRKVEFCSPEEHLQNCFNGASCLYLDSSVHCLCSAGFYGPKCELKTAEAILTTTWAHDGGDSAEALESCSPTRFLLLISSGLGGLVMILLVFLIVLCIKVRQLSCNPRIHRRFVVSRPDITTSRGPPVNVCEMVDIENCCNMTICDTPCYETSTGNVSIIDNSSDKERLLDY